MKRKIKRVLVLTVGWAFILFGIAGLFLPVLQGILFILIGLIILSSEYSWAHRMLERLRRRFPKFAAYSDQATTRAGRWLRRLTHRER